MRTQRHCSPAPLPAPLTVPAPTAPAAGLFQCSAGDIVLGVVLLLLLPVSFLGGAFWLLFRWLQHPELNRRRAIFVLQRDPLAAAIAAPTPDATPRGRSAAALPPAANGAAEGAANGAEGAAARGDGAAALAASSRDMAVAQARRWSFIGFSRSLCGEPAAPSCVVLACWSRAGVGCCVLG